MKPLAFSVSLQDMSFVGGLAERATRERAAVPPPAIEHLGTRASDSRLEAGLNMSVKQAISDAERMDEQEMLASCQTGTSPLEAALTLLALATIVVSVVLVR